MPIIGRTRCRGQGTADRLQSWLSPTNALTLVSNDGHDISGIRSTGRSPRLPRFQQQPSFARTLLELARREKMTLRDLYNITAARAVTG